MRTLALLLLLLAPTSGCDRTHDRARSKSSTQAPIPKATPQPQPDTAPPLPPSRACDHLRFFDIYRQADAVKAESESKVQLTLRFDLHGVDCGAPDGYGHDTELTLGLEATGDRCLIQTATASHQHFGDEMFASGPLEWRSEFATEGSPNLADPSLKEFVLRAPPSKEAIRLERLNYYYFPDASPGQKLAGLHGDDSPKGPAYGYTSSHSSRWFTTYWLSPLAFSSERETGKSGLDEYNRWATKSGLRNDLPALLERTFDRDDQPVPQPTFGNGTPPMSAKVTFDRKYASSPSEKPPKSIERRTLQYSRKPCSNCEGGATGWWLWSARIEWHCQIEDGESEAFEHPCGSWEQVQDAQDRVNAKATN